MLFSLPVVLLDVLLIFNLIKLIDWLFQEIVIFFMFNKEL